MMFSRRTGNKTIRIFKQKRVFIMSALCAILVISLVTRPASAAVAFRTSSTIGNSAATTSLSVAMPTGTVVNDVMIAILSVRGGSGVTVTPPLGWTLINSANTTTVTTMKSSTYSKVAGVSEAGPYAFSFTSGLASLSVSSYSGVDTAAPIDTQAVQANAASLTLTAPTVTTTVANAMLVAMYSTARGAVTLTAGSGMTIRSQVSSTGTAANSTTTGSQDAAQAVAGISGTKTMTANGTAALNVGHLIALRPAPVVSQVNYRFFQNTDSTTASTPYTTAGTPASIAGTTPFRLRLNLGVASGGTSVTNTASRSYKLQYALRGGDNTCDTSFSGETYADVGPATTVQFYNNATPVDGAAYVTSVNDPTRAGITAVGQKYEESNPLVVGTTTPANQDMLWDISLTTSGVSMGQTYCMRVLDSNNSSNLSNGYTVIPEFTIPTPTVGQANYRWFPNLDATTPGTPTVAQDTVVSIPSGTPIRLRLRLAADVGALLASAGSYKMQYAEKVGTCDAGFSGENYVSVMTSGGVISKLGSSASETAGGGNTPWGASLSSLNIRNDSYSGIGSAGADATSYMASLTGYNFNVPASATVTGLEIEIPYTAIVVSPSYNPNISAGPIGGTFNSQPFTNGSGVYYYGGSSSALGVSPLNPAVVNAAGFGFGLQLTATFDPLSFDDSSIRVDSLTGKVYYTLLTAIAYFNNITPASGASISSTGNDPTNGARPTVLQTYREDDTFTNTSSIAAGSDGLWDFALNTTGLAAGKSYCFRAVKADNSLLDAYTQIPEIAVTSSGPTLDQQLRGGQAVLNGVKQPSSW